MEIWRNRQTILVDKLDQYKRKKDEQIKGHIQ